MSCCNGSTEEARVLPNPDHFPDHTFCCMGRMAYTLVCKAESFYATNDNDSWTEMNDAERAEWGRKAKKVLKGEPLGVSTFDLFFTEILKTMTTMA